MLTNVKVISLPHRLDRREHITQQLRKHNIRFEFVTPEAPTPDTKIGNGASSLYNTTYKLISEAVANETHVTIMEDDLIFTSDLKSKYNEAYSQLPDNFDMLYLTGQVFEDNWNGLKNTLLTPYNRNLLKPRYMLGTQAYHVSDIGAVKLKAFMDSLTTMQHEHVIDVVINYFFVFEANIYVCKPFLVKEDPNLGTDISVHWDKTFTYKYYED